MFDIDAKRIEITNEEEKTLAPDFWNNARRAEEYMRVLRAKKKWVTDYDKAVSLTDDTVVLFDFYKENEATETEVEASYESALKIIEDLEFKNMLSEEGDALSAVLQITAGAGGTESCDWASI
ncbi:MAG TPA: PCRF domain-containing protein, partial [Flavobacteriaceae bacterium]|nr:PCRF domain-containing protein [Flavobacteriaceae bacterium]